MVRVPLSGTAAAYGVLIRGAIGVGKSTLALTLIERFDALLVADDQIELSLGGTGEPIATCPERIAGLLEVRGVGLVPYPHLGRPQSVDLIVELQPDGLAAAERLPEAAYTDLGGLRLPLLVLPNAADALAERVLAGLRLLAAGHWSKLEGSDANPPAQTVE